MVAKSSRAAALACAVVVGSGWAGATEAATFFATTNSYSSTDYETGPFDERYGDGQVPVSVTSYSLTDSPVVFAMGWASGFAEATRGAVRSRSFGAGQTNAPVCCPSSGGGVSNGRAQYDDTFILTAPGIASGTIGSVTADALITGFAGGMGQGANWSGSASWRVDININGTTFRYRYSGGGNSAEGLTFAGDAAGLRSLSAPVTFGQENVVILSVMTSAGGGAGQDGFNEAVFTSDLGSTVSWEGITRLTVGGMEVTEFSAVSSTSGFDFARGFGAIGAAPVPEPGTWAMMILGFGLTGAALRRRRLAWAA